MINIEFFDLFVIGCVMFVSWFWGLAVMRLNVLVILLSVELMLLGVGLNFVLYSVYLDDVVGQVIGLLLLTVAAAESAIGLAIFVGYHRMGETLAVSYLHVLKG